MNRLTGLLFLLVLLTGASAGAQVAERAEQIAPLLIGESIPALTLPDAQGQTVVLADLLKTKPTVLVFYRGGWCPYCNVHLAELAKAEAAILQLGYQIVAISPDAPAKLAATAEKNQTNYRLLSDSKGELIQAMGLAFTAAERLQPLLSSYSGGDNSQLLPVPALFVVNTKGVILFEYISPTYTQRISSGLLLAVLPQLQP